ncbi:MAG: TIGR03435 family protein [Terracidiphilus sp.]
MKTRVESRTMRSGWKALSSLAGCAALAVALAMGSQANRAAAQSPAPAAQTAAPAGQTPSTALTPASPKDVLGIWQGTLHIAQANRDLRTELKITQAAAGEYKVTFYSIDQGGQPLAASKTTFQDGTLTFTMDAIGGKYEGKMSADGKTITGTWTQGPNPLALVLTRTNPDAAWPIPEPLKPMAADANPSFEVATIKPNNSGATQMQALVIRGRNFMTRASSVQDLLSFAYNVQSKQIVNGPAWIGSDRFDIDAVPDAEGVPNTQQIRVMIQKLLADRFKLTFHHEQREMEAYVLEVGKSGPKMTVNESKGQLPGLGFGPGQGGISLRAMNATMGDLTGFLQVIVLDRPVVDRTGLTARYDIKCTFTPDDSQFNGHPPRIPGAADGAAPADAAAAPSLYEAFQEQLGLKLTAEKTQVDVIVIDHVEKPSPN